MLYKQYLSKIANNINPYQWEEIPSGKVLRFDTNTLPYPPPSIERFINNLKNYCPINEYTDPSYRRLKELLSKYEGVKNEMISVTNSGDEAIDILAKTFLDPGDCFVATPPTYEMFSIQCNINNGKSSEIPLKKNDFQIDTEKIINAGQNPKVKLIFLVNPNNPTASIIPQKEIEKILQKSNAIVVVDEVYREFCGESSIGLLPKYRNLVILRSFSKFAAMAGARIGYLIADPKLIEIFEGIRLPMGASFLSYKLAECVLEYDLEWIKDQADMIIIERKRLTKELTKMGLYVYPSYANFLLVKIGSRANEICRRLKKKRIIIRDRSKKKYTEGCVRITVRSPEENKQLLAALKEINYARKN